MAGMEGYVTLLKAHKRGHGLKFKLKCLVNGKKRVTSSIVMVPFNRLEVGEETKWSAGSMDYDMRGASECEVTFMYGPMFGSGQAQTILKNSCNEIRIVKHQRHSPFPILDDILGSRVLSDHQLQVPDGIQSCLKGSG